MLFAKPAAGVIHAAILGLAIGDALGVPVEFTSRESRRECPVTALRGFGSHRVPAGTWSDDTSMTLATLDSLTHALDYEDMMRCFCDWMTHAAYTATDYVFDMGITTHLALHRFLQDTPALECGGRGEFDNGNGSLMRILPAALYCQAKRDTLSTDGQLAVIHRTSQLTHAHPRSMMACGIYAFIVMALCDGEGLAGVETGLCKARAYYGGKAEFSGELPTFGRLLDMPVAQFAALPEEDIRSSGYVVDTLEAALWCLLNTQTYRDCVLKAVNLGSDTDTTAAVAGGLAGCLYGLAGIPQAWQTGLIRADMLAQYCRAFAASLA